MRLGRAKGINKGVFIAWAPYCRRSDVLGKYFNYPVLFINHLIRTRNILWRYFFWVDYIFKGIYTLLHLIQINPKYVFAQSPPSFCPMFCWIYCKVFRRKLIVDGHNNAFDEPWISFPCFLYILSSSKMVLVHNDELEKYLKIKYRNIPFYILPDKIPDFPLQNENIQNPQKAYFLAPVTFSFDEPIEEMLDAIRLFLDTTKFPMEFIITGNYKIRHEIYDKYHNVQGIRFVGYVDNPTYDKLLTNAFGVIALTTRQMTQQCAAVEAMGANVPLIVSDTDTNRRLFSQGAIITSIDRNSIKNSFEQFIREKGDLLDGITERKKIWIKAWDEAFIGLKHQLALESARNPVPGSGTVDDPVHPKTTVEPVDR